MVALDYGRQQLLECTCCSKQYVEKRVWPFRFRIKSLEQNKLLLVEQHFCLKDHDFNNEFAIIEDIEREKINNIPPMVELMQIHRYYIQKS